jgi:hypothetical protein
MERIRILYEWDAETVDWLGDILDHNHGTLVEALKTTAPEGQHVNVVLIKEEYCESEKVTDRTWAHVSNGKLPNKFEDGKVVPERFHAVLEKETK